MMESLGHPAALPAILLVGTIALAWRVRRTLDGAADEATPKVPLQCQSLFEQNTDGVIEVDRDGLIRGLNPAARTLLGRDDLIGRAFLEILSSESRGRGRAALDSALGGRHGWLSSEVSGPEGPLEVEITSFPIIVQKEVAGAYQVLRDVTDRRKLERALQDRALHDYLTGLPNRALFADRLKHALRRGRRAGERVALLYIDLDRFKLVNDRAGHRVGDELLREVAGRLRSLVRESDTVARVGGDEFAVLLETVDGDEEAVTAAERIVTLVRAPIRVEGSEHHVGASVGVALSSEETETPDDLVHQADVAMYEAKRQGGFQFRVYGSELEGDGGEDRAEGIRSALREAVDEDRLALEYQPIVETDGSRIVGVEALVRWHHPELGRLRPASFLPIAEGTPLIADVDRWVLDRSCRDVRRLVDLGVIDPPFCLSVNLSPTHFEQSDFLPALSTILDGARFDPGMLQLELGERSAASDPEKVRGLKALGVRIAIDDFGTGLSTLSYLRDLDVDVLKVDRAFVLALASDRSSLAIVRTVLSLAEILELGVIVEGIEDRVQLGLLEEMGGTLVQGFYFGQPTPAEDLAHLISDGVPWDGRAGRESAAVPPPLPGPGGEPARAIIPAAPRRWGT